jgi:propionyl-CoA carboxylase beta chain
LTPTDDPNREGHLIERIVSSNDTYDMKEVISMVLDQGDFMEVHEEFALNIIVGFGRMGGKTVGIIANQPLVLNGMIDSDAADKSANFVSFCDAFNVPMVNFVDCPGYLGGKEQEQRGRSGMLPE